MSKILIAYVTKTGSTKEVAYEISKVLQTEGHEITVKSVDEVETFEGYTGVIVGAPINGMMWHQKAVEFVKNNSSELNSIPTSYFLLSYTVNQGRKFITKKIKGAFSEVSKIVKPIHVGIFGGRIDKPMPSILRFIFGMPKDAKDDQRDWNRIKEWAAELATKY